jgi:spore maturation protein CgeB
MKVFVFGSSLTSSYWNKTANYYRGIYKNLADFGFEITFAQPDRFPWQEHRDEGSYEYAEVIVYDSPYDLPALFRQACEADLVIRHSCAGADDWLLDQCVLECKSTNTQVAFWDIDAASTFAAVKADVSHPLRALISEYDYVFTNGGGPQLVEDYEKLGARTCHPICHGLDSTTHYPVPPDPKLACDLLFLGDNLPEREVEVENLFLAAADLAPEFTFALGGDGLEREPLPKNVRRLGRIEDWDQNGLNCSARLVLNLTSGPMARVGFSPPMSIFEAAGAGACMISDPWEGIETFFEPGCEILVAQEAGEIVDLLRTVDPKLAREIGGAMRRRANWEHTYASRALQIREILKQQTPEVLSWRRPVLKQTA